MSLLCPTCEMPQPAEFCWEGRWDCPCQPPRAMERVLWEALNALRRRVELLERVSKSGHPGGYSAADRETWRAEIAEAKRVMSPAEFADWLHRKINVVSISGHPPTKEEQ